MVNALSKALEVKVSHSIPKARRRQDTHPVRLQVTHLQAAHTVRLQVSITSYPTPCGASLYECAGVARGHRVLTSLFQGLPDR